MLNINGRTLCEHCFAEINPQSGRCSYCSYPKNCERYPTALPEGSILAGRYVVGRVLGKGGFGVTYLCYDSKERGRVALKEYLPDSLTHRNTGETSVTTYGGESEEYFKAGAQKFYDEARLVSRFNGNPNIISVYEFFYENNTTYFVMEYLDGIDLKHYIKENGGKISEEEALFIALRMSEALMIVHSTDVLHRDISPDNIFLCNDGKVKLIDFGAARQVIGEASKSLSVILKQGFAPLEQYQKKGKQGPWTDIYALGASIYYAITGEILDDAMSRITDDEMNLDGITPEFAEVIRKMLAVKIDDRYQNTFELKTALAALPITPKSFEIKVPEKTAAPEAVTEVLSNNTPAANGYTYQNDYNPVAAQGNPNYAVNGNYITPNKNSGFNLKNKKTVFGIIGAIVAVLIVLLIIVAAIPDKDDEIDVSSDGGYSYEDDSPTESNVPHLDIEDEETASYLNYCKTVSAGEDHSVALKSDGTVVAIGGVYEDDSCDVGDWEDIVSVEAGFMVTYGVKADGTVVSAGFYDDNLIDIFEWEDIVSISEGGSHIVGLKSDGTVVAAGDNTYGECNVSTWEDVIKIRASGHLTVGLKSDGTVVSTGNNDYGQLDASNWTDIIDIDTDGYRTIGVKSDGTLAVSGSLYGDLQNIRSWKDIVAIAMEFECVVGLKSDGTVIMQYDRDYYSADCNVTYWEDIVAIEAGSGFILGLKSDGTVIATGNNEYGQCEVDEWESIKIPEPAPEYYSDRKKSKFDGIG